MDIPAEILLTRFPMSRSGATHDTRVPHPCLEMVSARSEGSRSGASAEVGWPGVLNGGVTGRYADCWSRFEAGAESVEIGGDALADLAGHQWGGPAEESAGAADGVDGDEGAVGGVVEFIAHEHRERPVDFQFDQSVGLVSGDDVAVGEAATEELGGAFDGRAGDKQSRLGRAGRGDAAGPVQVV